MELRNAAIFGAVIVTGLAVGWTTSGGAERSPAPVAEAEATTEAAEPAEEIVPSSEEEVVVEEDFEPEEFEPAAPAPRSLASVSGPMSGSGPQWEPEDAGSTAPRGPGSGRQPDHQSAASVDISAVPGPPPEELLN